MQIVTSKHGLSMVVAAVSLMVACGGRRQNIEYSVLSPDEQARINVIVSSGWMMKPVLRIELKTSERSIVLYENPRSELIIKFAEVAWAPDSDLVGIYVNNPYGESALIGYSCKRGAMVAFRDVKDLIRQTIAKNYRDSLSERGGSPRDPLEWADTVDGQASYSTRVKSKTLGR